MLKGSLSFFAVLTLVALSGCGGDTTPSASTPAAPAASGGGTAPAAAPAAPKPAAKKTGGGEAYSADKATATIKGTVALEGTPPKRPQVDMSGTKECAAMHGEPILKEEVVSKDGKLQNVVVYVKSGSEKWTYDALPRPAVTLTQTGCQYKPHVLTMMVDQPLEIVNDDPLAHNVHGTPKQNPQFNISQANKGRKDTTPAISAAELGMQIQCDVHKWMAAWGCVFEHPFFAVTDENGNFEIKLPPGEYEIATWQESAKGEKNDKLVAPAAVKVTVGDKETKQQDFSYKVK